MPRLPLAALAIAMVSAAPVFAQQQPSRCATPDTIFVAGNQRVTEAAIRSQSGLAAGAALTPTELQRALRTLYGTGQFSDVRLDCVLLPEERAGLRIVVAERPLLGNISVEGAGVVPSRTILDRVSLIQGQPLDPARVAQSAAAIDSVYEARGFYLTQVEIDSTARDGALDLVFRIEEGGRLAISGVEIRGNQQIPTGEIVGAMRTKPEGFLWFRRGAFDETSFAGDVGERIPALYSSRGFIDAVVTQDTVVVDRALGKGIIVLTVEEGPQYELGRFDVVGNQRFSSTDIEGFYPFGDAGPTLSQRITDVIRRRSREEGVFDQARWEEATENLRTAYNNEGYIFANVSPVVERTVGPDSQPVVNLRWEINEGSPAIVNRVEIVGNDYTEEACIRRQLITLPGSVFNRDYLIRSWQSISNLGFFENPLPPPDVQPNEEGDVDIIFTVKERRTGNVNFGASMGEGTGVGGFIGLDQPNLFGQCKRGSVQWQFGRYQNNANVSYTDPAIGGSLISGTVNAYHTRSRYRIADLGQSVTSGGSVRVGFPVRGSNWTRAFVSYGGESVEFGSEGLLGSIDSLNAFGSSFRSTLGLDLVRDTRVGLPFPIAGSQQSFTAQFNGGPLGGNTNFQRYTTELRGYATLGSIGGGRPGSSPMEFVIGLTGRAGALFGDPGQFFFSQQFTLGGVQYGEQLRGYPEFSITPNGFVDSTDTYNAQRNSFGSAFFSTTAELGFRFNPSLYLNAFLDAGNVWRRATDFNPTRLFRGAGLGVSTITPLGPLGLDYAYGFDRTTRDPVTGIVRPAPKWQFHFRLGQLF